MAKDETGARLGQISRCDKKLKPTALALTEQDDECLKVMAQMFQKLRMSFMDMIYWDDLLGPFSGCSSFFSSNFYFNLISAEEWIGPEGTKIIRFEFGSARC